MHRDIKEDNNGTIYTAGERGLKPGSRNGRKLKPRLCGNRASADRPLQEGTGVAARVLEENGVEESKVVELVSQLISPNTSVQMAENAAYTPRARRVIENSYREAVRFKAAQIGTEHILIAILREGDCVASRL